MANREQPFSATVDLTLWSGISKRALLFGEAQARVVVSTDSPADIERIAAAHGVPARRIGVVEAADRPFRIQYEGGQLVARMEQLANAYHNAIPSIMTRVAVADDDLRRRSERLVEDFAQEVPDDDVALLDASGDGGRHGGAPRHQLGAHRRQCERT